MDRREFLRTAMMAGAAGAIGGGSAEAAGGGQAGPPAFELDEVTIADLQSGMEAGKYTARSIAELYLRRIEQVDKAGPAINAVIEVNPDALAIAEALDTERKTKGPRGPLHGIPVLIKDNIDTADKMMTTAGSLALAGTPAPHDSFVAQKLREAGAVILGKTNLSEWANIRSNHSTSGWSGRGGQTRCPYALDRNPSGSSSGTGAAIAANLAAVGIGTETDGSITSPSNNNCLVGLKPTVGLVSRAGVVPISHSQDTAGPMARTVRDAAILLGALTGVDPRDAATGASAGKSLADYTRQLDPNGLQGARIGIARKFAGFDGRVDKLFVAALDALKAAGAVLIDPADVPTAGKFDDSELTVLLYELKADLNSYLAARGATAPVRTLQDVIAFNEQHADRELTYFGQELFVRAQLLGPLSDAKYKRALAKNHKLARAEGIDAVMDKHQLDALVAPTGGPAWTTDLVLGDHGTGGGTTSPAAVAGYPHITVPMGFVFGLPVGLSFFGRAWSEAALLRLAYAFEQATKHRRPPRFVPTAELG